MYRKRFFVPQERIRDGLAFLPSDQIHHLRDVLRLSEGDEVEVFDGEGAAYSGKVEHLGSETRIGQLRRLSANEERGVRVTLAPALIKTDRFEWMIEKAAELGADEIIPLVTRFSEIRIPMDRLESRLERWRRIAMEASKQCRRLCVPKISTPIPFAELLSFEMPRSASRLLFYENAAVSWDRSISSADHVLICTGPEGGWDMAEVEAAHRAGFGVFRLGQRILRAETAALATLAVIRLAIEEAAD